MKCQYYGNNKSFRVKDFNILSETDRWFRKLNCKKLKCKKKLITQLTEVYNKWRPQIYIKKKTEPL